MAGQRKRATVVVEVQHLGPKRFRACAYPAGGNLVERAFKRNSYVECHTAENPRKAEGRALIELGARIEAKSRGAFHGLFGAAGASRPAKKKGRAR